MMRLGAALYRSPTGTLLLDLQRARQVRFGTNERGFAAFSCEVDLLAVEAFYLYDRPGLPHLSVVWGGLVVWKGRLEDVALTANGLRLTALGYIRGYADVPYSGSHIGVSGQTIVQALVAAVAGANSFMAASTVFVQNPGVTLVEIYEDRYPIDILDRLCNLGDSQTTPRLWEAAVWEQRLLYFQPRGRIGRKWFADVAAPDLERTLETLWNSAYAVYQDGGNQRALTATSTDSHSVNRFGLTRRAAIQLQAQDATLAGKVRDSFVAEHKTPPLRAGIVVPQLYDVAGRPWPAFVARSGDQVTLRNLPPTASIDVDRLRTFRMKETDYDAELDQVSIVPEALYAGLAPESNIERLYSITDPNFDYQPRPTLAEIYAQFTGLPNLRALWSFSSLDNAGNVFDVAGQGRSLTLTAGGSSAIYNDRVGYFDYNGSTGYHSRADEAALDITAELTFGGWFWADTLTAIMQFMGKSDVTLANDSYRLTWRGDLTGDPVQFSISDGATVYTVGQSSSGTRTSTGKWYFIVGRFIPSTEIALFINEDGVTTSGLTKYTNTTSIPAAIVNGASAFRIGASGAASRFLDGRASLAFLEARALSDAHLDYLFNRSRRLFAA